MCGIWQRGDLYRYCLGKLYAYGGDRRFIQLCQSVVNCQIVCIELILVVERAAFVVGLHSRILRQFKVCVKIAQKQLGFRERRIKMFLCVLCGDCSEPSAHEKCG